MSVAPVAPLNQMGNAIFTTIDTANTLNLSMDSADHLLRRRTHNGDLERFQVTMLDTSGRRVLGYVYRIPNAKTVNWEDIRHILARPHVASTLPLIKKTSTRADYDKLWNTQPGTTASRLKELVRCGVLAQSYKRMRHETGLSSLAAFYTPTKVSKRNR